MYYECYPVLDHYTETFILYILSFFILNKDNHAYYLRNSI